MTGEGSEAEIGLVDIDLGYREKIKSQMPLLRRMYAYQLESLEDMLT